MGSDSGETHWVYKNSDMYEKLRSEVKFIHSGENITLDCPDLTVELDEFRNLTADQSTLFKCT